MFSTRNPNRRRWVHVRSAPCATDGDSSSSRRFAAMRVARAGLSGAAEFHSCRAQTPSFRQPGCQARWLTGLCSDYDSPLSLAIVFAVLFFLPLLVSFVAHVVRCVLIDLPVSPTTLACHFSWTESRATRNASPAEPHGRPHCCPRNTSSSVVERPRPAAPYCAGKECRHPDPQPPRHRRVLV